MASVFPTPCPLGTYNSEPDAGFLGNCRACDADQACPFTGLLTPNATCAAGHYCPAGTVTPTENACPPGTYSDSRALMRVEQCDTCPPGKACGWGTGGVDNPPSYCAKGPSPPRPRSPFMPHFAPR